MNPMFVQRLDSKSENEYESFVSNVSKPLIYYSLKFRQLLRRFLDAEDIYFLARDAAGEIVGVLPAFLKKTKHGNVLNALPFYGSHGGVLTSDKSGVVHFTLLEAFNNLAESNNCLTSTVITTPFDISLEFYEKYSKYTHRDSRIGQLTPLPESDDHDVPNLVMGMIHPKPRNMIRKAQKAGISVVREEDLSILSFIATTHREHIESLRGIAKPLKFFNDLSKTLRYGDDYDIYSAHYEGKLIGGLLLLRFGRTIEYFCPVTVADFRSIQPLSLIIFKAMCDAVKEGYHWWNWGGTWHTQNGVYNFKKRWGTEDYPYYYFTRLLDSKVTSMTSSEVLEVFSHFYVIPFTALQL